MITIRHRFAQAWPVALAGGAVALLATAFLIGSTPDEEEFRFAVLSAWLRIRSLAAGEYPFWTSALGLGIPQPFVPSFCLHPLLPLLGFMTPVAWVRVVLAAHATAAATGIWFVGRRLSLAPSVRAVCVVTYLLAAPSQNYVLTDFWPSHFLMWTSVPWLLLLAWRILDQDGPGVWRAGVTLGLVAGLVVANTNPGHAGVYVVLALGLVVAHRRATSRQWGALAVALALAAAIAAPNVVHLVGERRLFPEGLGLSNVPDPLKVADAVEALKRPLGASEGTRTLFFGAPFAALAVIGCAWFARTRMDLAVGAVVAAVLLFTSSVPIPTISARYQFRDPLTLCAVLLAGLAANRLLSQRVTRWPTAVILLLQTGLMTAAALPYIERTWQPDGMRASAFRGATGATPLGDAIVENTRTPGRLLYSPLVDEVVAARSLVDDGVGINALAYRGVSVVNGSFKSVATDALWPNDKLYYGWIRTPKPLVESDEALNLLGIRYVLAFADEQVAPGLRVRFSHTTIRDAKLVLLENADASTGAFLMEPALAARPVAVLPGCGNDRLLCRDLGQLAGQRDRTPVSVERSSNAIRATWAPGTARRVLVLTEMYRSAWTATAGGKRLTVKPVFGGFLGVSVQPGVSAVRFEYRPYRMIVATGASYAAIAGALAWLVVAARRRTARPQASAATAKSP